MENTDILARAYKKTRNFLHYTQHFSVHSANQIIKRFGIDQGIVYPEKGARNYPDRLRECNYASGEIAQNNWDDFMEFYGTVKRDYKRENSDEVYGQEYLETFNGN